jgi:hypothetical protein
MVKRQTLATTSGSGCDIVGPLLNSKEAPNDAEAKDGEHPA